MFKNVPLTKNSLDIRLVTRDVAVVHFNSRVGAFVTPGGTHMPEATDIALMIFVRTGGIWLLTAAENIVVEQ